MYTVFDKLYLGRLILGFDRKDAAAHSATTQVGISLLERGERRNIPAEYLQFLYDNGIDMNWLFSEDEDLSLSCRKKSENITEEIKHLCEQLSNLSMKVDDFLSHMQAGN